MRALHPSWPRTYITGTAFILKLVPDLQKVSVQIVWRGEIVPVAVAVYSRRVGGARAVGLCCMLYACTDESHCPLPPHSSSCPSSPTTTRKGRRWWAACSTPTRRGARSG